MHTYIKHDTGEYSVGMWLPNREGITAFVSMFDVGSRVAAVTAVNMLNGGDTSQKFTVLREH